MTQPSTELIVILGVSVFCDMSFPFGKNVKIVYISGSILRLINTCGLAPAHQDVSLDLPIIFIDREPATNWKFIDCSVSQIIHNHLHYK